MLGLGPPSCKAEQVKYRDTRPLQFPPPLPSLALIHLSLWWSQSGCRQAGWRSPLREKRGSAASALQTHCQTSLMVSHYTTSVPPLMLLIGPAHEAGLSTGMWKGQVPPRKRKKERSVNAAGDTLWKTNDAFQQSHGGACSTPVITGSLCSVVGTKHSVQTTHTILTLTHQPQQQLQCTTVYAMFLSNTG